MDGSGDDVIASSFTEKLSLISTGDSHNANFGGRDSVNK